VNPARGFGGQDVKKGYGLQKPYMPRICTEYAANMPWLPAPAAGLAPAVTRR
jgi:hypothetical protein